MTRFKTIAVRVFFQKKTLRQYVGILTHKKDRFVFEYHDTYRYSDTPLALGPDLPLARTRHTSKRLFDSFDERLPSPQNPAYSEYCKSTGISPDESDPIVLLSHIAYKGPSSFVFAPVYAPVVTAARVKGFRRLLGLSLREFAALFEFSPATVQRIETGKNHGFEAFRRLELYCLFPEAALFDLQRSFALHDDKKAAALQSLKKLIVHKK